MKARTNNPKRALSKPLVPITGLGIGPYTLRVYRSSVTVSNGHVEREIKKVSLLAWLHEQFTKK
jgi:hypothetical protein